MTQRPVRVRIAPSPTGDPHVGTAYQALFNYAFARKHGGRFVLRIEDTDRARSSPESEAAILESLRWLGLSWDEGPDVGGPHAPYRQSERSAIYREHAETLLASGRAYRCFATREELEQMRRAGTGYDRRYRDLDPAESKRRAAAGEPYVVRLRVPLDGECVMHDLLRGEIRKDWSSIDDQVLLKSDGFPTYHLANVVDDHLMEISHVIRGEEWINSLPKHLLLYESFGWDPPVFCHLPLLRNDDAAKSKLSKRKNPTSITYYRDAGFLPEAMVNFLGMLGWTRAEGDEKFTLEEFVEHFELERIALGGPVFDVKKLRWLNGRYIREDHDPARLRKRLVAWGYTPERLERILEIAQPRLETLADWGPLTVHFFSDEVPLDKAALVMKDATPEETADRFQLVLWRLEAERRFTRQRLGELFRETADALGVKLKVFTRPFYVALSGAATSTPLFESMEILGPDITRMRLRRAITALGGISSKRQKLLEKRYAELFGPRDPR